MVLEDTDLYVHAEEADVRPLLLLEGEHGPRSVREVVQHLPRVHVPKQVSEQQFKTEQSLNGNEEPNVPRR